MPNEPQRDLDLAIWNLSLRINWALVLNKVASFAYLYIGLLVYWIIF